MTSAAMADVKQKTGDGRTRAAESSDIDQGPAAARGERIHPEYQRIWKAHRISPERREAIRVLRESLARMFEGMDDFVSCSAHLDGAGGAEFRLRVAGENTVHGLRILLDADPDC